MACVHQPCGDQDPDRVHADIDRRAVAGRDEVLVELAATGGKVPRPGMQTRHQLTLQEEQIAQLARDGLSNPEIGAQLFLSARTVEWHLRKIFAKLGIGSRRELDAALGELGRDSRPV